MLHRWIQALSQPARYFYALAVLAFGVQQLIYGEFVTRVIPKLLPSIPWHPFWAYLTAVAMIVVGVSILLDKGFRLAGTLLGTTFLGSFLLLYLPALAAGPVLGAMWTNAGKALALSGGAFLVAGLWTSLSRFFLSAFLIVAGIQHFLFAPFVAGLVPSWMPGHLFWTWFAGVALIAGGIGIMIPILTESAGFLTGVMVLMWVFLLHIPRAGK